MSVRSNECWELGVRLCSSAMGTRAACKLHPPLFPHFFKSAYKAKVFSIPVLFVNVLPKTWNSFYELWVWGTKGKNRAEKVLEATHFTRNYVNISVDLSLTQKTGCCFQGGWTVWTRCAPTDAAAALHCHCVNSHWCLTGKYAWPAFLAELLSYWRLYSRFLVRKLPSLLRRQSRRTNRSKTGGTGDVLQQCRCHIINVLKGVK